jgi:hypothetical protein
MFALIISTILWLLVFHSHIAQLALDHLLFFVQELGFDVAWDKVSQPATVVTFLGIEIDCLKRTLSLPPKKLNEIRELVECWSKKEKATKREFQKCVGKLNWAARVVRGGRSFMRNIIDLISKAKYPHHHIRLSSAAKNDISWWKTDLRVFHGVASFSCDQVLPSHEFATDACLSGGGGHFGQSWFYVSWFKDYPELVSAHINVLELKTV